MPTYGSGYSGALPPYDNQNQPAEPNRNRHGDQGQPPGQIKVPATLVVNLPADARLTIDDHPTRSTSSVRLFITPALQLGKTFHYTLKAEVERNGETLWMTRDVEVRAGQETRVTLDFPGPA